MLFGVVVFFFINFIETDDDALGLSSTSSRFVKLLTGGSSALRVVLKSYGFVLILARDAMLVEGDLKK